jgi:hypothetical protein
MPYRWNPLWTDPGDPISAAYTAAIRRMVVASINWLAEHPEADPEWDEIEKRAMARRAGIPDDVPISRISFAGHWKDFFTPRNPDATAWFNAIAAACEDGGPTSAPSSTMFDKAVACGALFKHEGWDAFNTFMLQPDSEGVAH